MSTYIKVKGEAFDGAPAFNISVNEDEMIALLKLSTDTPLYLQSVGSGEFFLSRAKP